MASSDQYTLIAGKEVTEHYNHVLDLIKKNQATILGKFLNDEIFSSIDIDRWAEEFLNKIISNKNLIQVVLFDQSAVLRGALFINRSDWDSEHFDLCIGKVQLLVFDKAALTQRKATIRRGFQEAKTRGYELIISRIPLANYLTIQALELSGAFLTDTMLTYRVDKSENERPPQHPSNVRFEVASSKEGPELGMLAQDIFKIDHFHADPNLDESKSDELYAKWTINSVHGLADHVVLARLDSTIAGFITCKIENFTGCFYGVIDLIGVSKEQRQSGIGSLLVKESLEWFSDKVHTVYVGTQARNVGAIRLYEKNGFKLVSSEATFHVWL